MAKFHLPTLEEEQLKKWDERGVLNQVFARSADMARKPFVFFEGPPTANGKPGIHHLLARSFKDVMLRFKTMQGYRIDRKAGWDTHGLPVELQVEKELGFTKKQDIEQYGIAAFNEKCKESVWTFLDLWQKSTRRVAFWVDMENPYITYKNDYVESLWHIFGEVEKKGLLYKGFRVTPHCPRCVTSLSSHELAQGYKDVEDPSVFVKFAVSGAEKKFFLVWTTTPWTLPGNVALAVGAGVTYVEARMKETGEVLILAKDLLGALKEEYELVVEMTGDKLVGTAYSPLYATLADDTAGKEKAHMVYAADFVSTSDGTGIVHIAPAFGEDDSRLGKEAGLPTLLTVDTTGLVTSDVPGKGEFFKDADKKIRKDLRERKLLYRDEQLKHSYPFCWRCDTPILYYAKSSWYIRMSSLRNELIANNEQINWIPAHIKEGRFGEWLKDVKDWAISRERYWGTPLPIWECAACKKTKVVGSLKQLEEGGTPRNTLYLQRHGESSCNAGEVVCSWPETNDHPLTEAGKAEVLESARKLKAAGVQRVFSSDLQRTKETAAIIAAETGLEVVFDERLRELDFGTFNNKTIKEYHERFAHREGANRFTDRPEGGESLNDLRARALSFLKELQQKYQGEKIVIVSHGDVLWMMQTMCKGLSDEQVLNWKDYPKTGSYYEMTAPANLPYDRLGNVDVHRPFIDEVTIGCECGQRMQRVPDVADVWFDSGAMPYAQWHYPFENAERIDSGENFPADFISEAIDQTRGWFYTLLAVSTLLGKKVPPYKNVICLGHILDAKGKKMSKSKGNVVDPFEAMDTFGADVIRYYMFTVNQPGEAKRFDEKAVEDVNKKVFMILWNVLTYYKMYAGENAAFVETAPLPKHEMDSWILAETARLTADVSRHMEVYDVTSACRELGAFVNDLSTWYVRRSRDRFKDGGAAAAEATQTLGFVLGVFAKLTAPFTPFLAEALYAELGGKADSVHLLDWPSSVDAETYVAVTKELREQMTRVRTLASLGLEQRAVTKMPVRQALASATVRGKGGMTDWMKAIVADELNVHDVLTEDAEGDTAVVLDTVLTPELKREGAARELTRSINDLRKQAGLVITDRIVVHFATTAEFWRDVLTEYGNELLGDVKADAFAQVEELPEGEGVAVLENDGQKIRVKAEKK